MRRAHLVISGDVQGVGFRSWALGQARDLHLRGWVKNREDGAVEIVAEGDQATVEEFAKRCRHGPDVAWVEHIDTTWAEGTGEFVGFEVVY
ncbi:hypothetical protein A2Z00_03270 [Candidatus Gottesmanbacteria bacterium RBG_13_45_10]|uniref:Acylphosphatase n=1 Tax=Candidatus Gottesmanbacteria bacterium RBG_13_45_10 TaxID=1798370 RepID=A0A1F5ZIU7_9BACT|nr:MAG: hypothetical protein A2Z00_03270 [Candidatus Gottesmanbacteria bacterium RBG_13_45_10]